MFCPTSTGARRALDSQSFTVAEASRILKKTLKSLGYGDEMAELGVWSALWLERRGVHGVLELVVYMLLIKDLRFDDLKPRRHDEYGLSGICPFMLAAFLASREDLLLEKKEVALGAPASPNLFAPGVTDLLSQSGLSLRIRHLNYACLFSKDGVSFESERIGAWGLVAAEDNGPMFLELTTDKATGLRKLDSIELPKKRLGEDGRLNLD